MPDGIVAPGAASALPQILVAHIDEFTPLDGNAKLHPDSQIEQIAASILANGWVWPILRRGDSVIGAGHGRREAAKLLYSQGQRIKMWNGFELPFDTLPYFDVSNWSEAEFKRFVLADNRLAEKGQWDLPLLHIALDELRGFDIDLAEIGFAQPDLTDLFGELGFGDGAPGGGLSDNYSRKIEAPIYRITGEKPAVTDLLDETKTIELQEEIEAAELPDGVREFLLAAAERHTVFNFRNIAEFYAHADAPLQRLMEKSALIIIDFNQAIENGFVRLSEGMMEQAELSKAKMAERDAA